MIPLLAAVFTLSLVLLGIHSWFGLEIIRRGIIFTDLAVGQMAALGAAVCLLLLDGRFLFGVSLAFALSGALLIAAASRRTPHLEAFIAALYALGISLVFILLSRSPHGMEEFHRLMASDILFVSWGRIGHLAVVYALIGGVIALVYPRLRGFSRDLFFFAVFAVTVTSSVQVAGVLTVFAILIAPASTAVRFGLRRPLFAAWVIGVGINLAAIVVSYHGDLPAGYTLVAAHSLTAVTAGLAGRKTMR